jgi:hypothetical protein
MSLALRTARAFWLKRNVKWLAVRPGPAPAGHSLLVSRFLPTRKLSNNQHNPASHHECKNTPTSLRSVRGAARHRDPIAIRSAATCTLFVHSPKGSWPHELARINRGSVPPNVSVHLLKYYHMTDLYSILIEPNERFYNTVVLNQYPDLF